MIRSLALLLFLASPIYALECKNDQFEDIPFSICSANIKQDDLRIFLKNDNNDVFGRFQTLDTYLQSQGLTLDFAMNGGMFRPDLTPVGLYIEDGKVLRRAVSQAGPGNFGMLPNGVFLYLRTLGTGFGNQRLPKRKSKLPFRHSIWAYVGNRWKITPKIPKK
jgi:uncharacterized protein YigE (DUF2233 family)